MNPARLLNCCTGHAAPDWSQFVQLEIAGCRSVDDGHGGECTEGLQPATKAAFFTVYGRRHWSDGTCEAITDIDDAGQALAVAAELAHLSGLPCVVHTTLMEDGR